MIEIEETLVLARQTPDGYTYTLASRLGHFLREAESLYGQRNRAFTILGIEFAESEIPQFWFPGNCGHVVVQLGNSAMRSTNQALFQLAHECIHLLDPAPRGTNNLEEGIATHFSYRTSQALGLNMFPGQANYLSALKLVAEMLAVEPDAARMLRTNYGPWRYITGQQISSSMPSIPTALADRLAAPF